MHVYAVLQIVHVVHELVYDYYTHNYVASGSLLVREIFGGKLTRTGTVAPSMRQKMSRVAVSPFSHFNKKTSKRLSKASVSYYNYLKRVYIIIIIHVTLYLPNPVCTVLLSLVYSFL